MLLSGEIGRGILQDPIQETALIDQAIQPNTTLKISKAQNSLMHARVSPHQIAAGGDASTSI